MKRLPKVLAALAVLGIAGLNLNPPIHGDPSGGGSTNSTRPVAPVSPDQPRRVINNTPGAASAGALNSPPSGNYPGTGSSITNSASIPAPGSP
jgi:hypothetical protein